MRMGIPHKEDGEYEGLLYDPTRADQEGLYEELIVIIEHPEGEIEKTLTSKEMQQIISEFDFGVNVEPGQVCELTVRYRYVYDYGRIEQPV
jgi:hypothetical protein